MTENSERGYTITRVFDAPRELVWDAWTKPEHFAVWFGTPQMPMHDVVLDVRPGGKWKGRMEVPAEFDPPEGRSINWTGHYIEVDRPDRLVIAFSDQAIIGADEFEIFTVSLTDLGDKTEMVLRQHGGHLTDEMYEKTREGTGSFIDAMADLLVELVGELQA